MKTARVAWSGMTSPEGTGRTPRAPPPPPRPPPAGSAAASRATSASAASSTAPAPPSCARTTARACRPTSGTCASARRGSKVRLGEPEKQGSSGPHFALHVIPLPGVVLKFQDHTTTSKSVVLKFVLAHIPAVPAGWNLVLKF